MVRHRIETKPAFTVSGVKTRISGQNNDDWLPVRKKPGCCEKGKLQARIIVSTLSYNNSVVIEDENGECHSAPVPDPVEEELIVKKGDRINDFEVLELTANAIVLKSSVEYTEDNASAPGTQFIIEKGECINLRLCGVCDAVIRTSVMYIETLGLTE